jgi:hypothetical protein
MDESEGFYTATRWQNWIDQIREADLDPEDEDDARLLLNMQDDTAIAIANILDAYDDGEIDAEAAVEHLAEVQEAVFGEVSLEDDDKRVLVDGVRTSLVCAFAAAEQYVLDGPADGSVGDHLDAAAEAEHDGDEDAALTHCARAGTLVVDGAALDAGAVADIEYGAVVEWVNGLDSLANALREPQIVEE